MGTVDDAVHAVHAVHRLPTAHFNEQREIGNTSSVRLQMIGIVPHRPVKPSSRS
jgi:hypothetical protein